jgi:hypothetical protein
MDERIKKAIEHELIRKPSAGFSDKLMERIFQLPQSIRVEPLISRNGWYFIATLSVIVFSTLLYTYTPSDTSNGKMLESWSNTMAVFVEKILSLSYEFQSMLVLAVVVFSVFILLTFDLFLGKKRIEHRK